MASLLTKLRNSGLFRRDSPVGSGLESLVWWEARRIPYNLIVGSAGIVTCVVVIAIAAAAEIFFHSEFGLPDPPLFAILGIILYGILANVCFTGGWITELFFRRYSPREADRFAINSFFYGVIFSVLLTLSPAALIGTIGFFRLLNHLMAK
jgi:Zn-dependent protease with chaperone function